MLEAELLGVIRDASARHDWQAAHDAARAAPFGSPELEAERVDLLADAAWWLGRLEECIAAREKAYRLFEDLGQHRRAGQCAIWLYEHHCFRARPAIASGWLGRARRALENDVDCAEYGALLLREAETAHGAGQLDHAGALATRAIALGRGLGSTNLQAEALQTLGRVLIDQGRPGEGLAHLDEAMLFAIEDRLGPYSTGKVYCSLISACEEIGDFRRAAEWTEATATWAKQHPFAIFPGICRIHRAVVLERRGALAEAEREATHACSELLGSHLANAAAAFAEVGDIRRRLGDLDRAEEAFARAQELSGRPCAGLALLRLAQGRVDAATDIITSCLHECGSSRLARAKLLPARAHVAAAAGDLGSAKATAAELDAIATDFGSATLRATALATRGRVELADRDYDAAYTTLRQALEAWQQLEVPYEVATTRSLLGEALKARGDEAGAAAALAAAAALFDQIGARLDAQVVRGSGSRTTLPAGLTLREAEVLQLIAMGRTNNEIADELYLSAKTVSRHVSNIFTKIGVTSRTAATAFAYENDLARS